MQPHCPDVVYLDNAASTPLLPAVLAELPRLRADAFANPASAHAAGRRLRPLLQRADQVFAHAAGADVDVVWTSGGTEANNLAILGLPAAGRTGAGLRLVTTATEHPSIDAPMQHLAEAERLVVPVDDRGQLDADALAAALTPDTDLVALHLVQNETGVVQDLPRVRRLMDEHAPRARLHVDAVQALGKLPLPWQTARIDTAAVSAHKAHGPGGVGALLLRPGTELAAILRGGGQQHNRRSGSLDVAGILAFARAVELLQTDTDLPERASTLNHRLRRGLEELPANVYMITPENASPFICTFALPACEGAVLLRMLSDRRIMVSTGSACSANRTGPSPVLTAMGVPAQTAFGALRVSFGQQNTVADVDALLTALRDAVTNY